MYRIPVRGKIQRWWKNVSERKKVQITIWLPAIPMKELQRKAKQRGVTIHNLIVIILQNYVRSCIAQE